MISKTGVSAFAIMTSLVAFTSAGGAPNVTPAPAASAIPSSCEALANREIAGLVIKHANRVPAGSLETGRPGPNGAPPPSVNAPAHCLVKGVLEARTGADGKPYAIAVELRIPEQWNGRLFYQGGGGLNGSVNVAYGANLSLFASSPPALARGFAVVTTDSGHDATNAGQADFANDQEAKLNYAYQAIGKVTFAAKALLANFAGSMPKRTYYVGCSNGGREALTAAQRYPSMFDGVAAGDPAFDLSKATLLAHYSTRQYRAANITQADMQLVGKAAVRACDALDGQRDGLIFNQRQCHFSVRSLECSPGQTANCLSTPKVAAIERAFRGPELRPGETLTSPWTYDSGVGDPGWMQWQTGMFTGLVDTTIANYFHYPRLEAGEINELDYAQALSRMASTAAFTDATSTDFSTFRARGGKVLIATGWSDPIFAPEDLVRWYDRDGPPVSHPGKMRVSGLHPPGLTPADAAYSFGVSQPRAV